MTRYDGEMQLRSIPDSYEGEGIPTAECFIEITANVVLHLRFDPHLRFSRRLVYVVFKASHLQQCLCRGGYL